LHLIASLIAFMWSALLARGDGGASALLWSGWLVASDCLPGCIWLPPWLHRIASLIAS